MKSVIRRASAGAALVTTLALLIAFGTTGLADPGSPFTITKVDSPDPVASGQELTYTITVVNTGGSKTTNVVLSDQLNGVGGIGNPPTLVLTSTRGSCTQGVNNLVTCSAGTIEGGGTWVVTIRGIVTAANGTTINNTVSVTGTRSAQNFTSTATATTLVFGGGAGPDLTISKTGPTSILTSTPMTYTLTVNNVGTVNANNVKVVDTVPAGVTVASAVGTSLFSCSVAGQTVTCTGGRVNAGSNATITINGTSPAAAGTITNTAAVDPDNAIEETNETNNVSALVNTEVTTTTPATLLTIDKTDTDNSDTEGFEWTDGAGPDPVNPGLFVTYKVIVRLDPTATRADDVVMVDGTQGLEAASITAQQVITSGTEGNSGGCVVEAPNIRCLARTLNPGGNIVYTIRGRVVASAGSTIINTATVTGNIRNVGHSSTDTELTTVKPTVDLTITKSDSPDAVCARSWPTTVQGGSLIPPPTVATGNLIAPPVCLGGLTYTLVVGNSGTQTATDVLVRDQLPADVHFDHAVVSGSPGACSVDASNVLTCPNLTVNPGAPGLVTITIVLVAPSALGSFSNTAVVDPNNAIFEHDETNNTDTEATQVRTGIDLVVRKYDDGDNDGDDPVPPFAPPPPALTGFDPIAMSGTQTYTILVDNIGPQDVVNVRVRDTLPANTIFRDVKSDAGFTCGHNAGVVECIGGHLAGTANEFYFAQPDKPEFATIKIRVFAQPFEGTMHNEVRVDPMNDIAEVDESNNIAFEDTVVEDNGPGAFIDLEIKKEGTATTTPGGAIDYTLKIWNTGTDPAQNVTVRDVLPAGTTFVSAIDGGGPGSPFTCAHASGVVTCTGATILGNTTEATAHLIKISVTAPNRIITLTNEAQVDPNNAINEGSEKDNTSTFVTQVQSVINLTISKDGPEKATQSQVATYTIKVKNEKPSGSDGQTAFGVEMHDPLPVGLIVLAVDAGSGNNWACQVQGDPINVVDCLGDLNPDQEVTITITVFITAETKRSLDNQACVDPENLIEEFDPPGAGDGESDNCSTHTTPFVPDEKRRPDLVVEKTGSPDSATPGQGLTYTITVTNQGNADAQGPITITDDVPAQTTFTSAVGTGWVCGEASGLITCTLAAGLAVGATADPITLDVAVDITAALAITNTAVAAPATSNPAETDAENETILDNNDGTEVTPVGEAEFDLAIGSIVDAPDPAIRGQQLTYTIVGLNSGGATATGVQIALTLPASGVVFLGAAGTNGFTCGLPASGVVTCVGDLPGGGSTAITAKFLVTLTAAADLTLSATIDPADAFAEPNNANNTQSETTTPSGEGCVTLDCVDLVAAQLVDSVDPVTAGSNVTYTLVVANLGAFTASLGGAQLAFFDLFGDVTLVGYGTSNPLISCSTIGSSSTFLGSDCFGDLGPGESVTLTIEVTVNSAGTVTARALVDPNNAVSEVNDFDAGPPMTFGNNLLIQVTTINP